MAVNIGNQCLRVTIPQSVPPLMFPLTVPPICGPTLVVRIGKNAQSAIVGQAGRGTTISSSHVDDSGGLPTTIKGLGIAGDAGLTVSSLHSHS
jgi:hypothetical protein